MLVLNTKEVEAQMLQAAGSTVAASADPKVKRELGSFYTVGNPFVYPGFAEWAGRLTSGMSAVEPFAGAGAIVGLIQDAGYKFKWELFDKDQSLKNVQHRDTLKDFPKGFQVAISNPPYLSYHFAKRKNLEVTKHDFLGFQSLYLVAIYEALRKCDYVAFIIPDSFATSKLFTERLEHLISLPVAMFEDTEMPTCLALWGPDETRNFKIWRTDQFVGTSDDLFHPLEATPCSGRIAFNRIDGQMGLKAIDDTHGPSIYFGGPDICPDEKVKHSGRLVSRIYIDNVDDTSSIASLSNEILSQWRLKTADFALTAFKGARADGMFRRRLDFANARAILSQAICAVEGHKHLETLRLEI